MPNMKPTAECEPYRDLTRIRSDGEQLDLLPTRLPLPRLSPRGRPPLSLAHVRTVLTAVLAVRTGRQPLTSVRGWVGEPLYTRLGGQASLDAPLTLKRMRGCVVPPSSYEVSATAATASRAYAVLARFDLTESAWRCTVFEVIAPPRPR